jgi:hypothetical protein
MQMQRPLVIHGSYHGYHGRLHWLSVTIIQSSYKEELNSSCELYL